MNELGRAFGYAVLCVLWWQGLTVLMPPPPAGMFGALVKVIVTLGMAAMHMCVMMPEEKK